MAQTHANILLLLERRSPLARPLCVLIKILCEDLVTTDLLVQHTPLPYSTNFLRKYPRATSLKARQICAPGYQDALIIREKARDRKSTRLNYSHVRISYAVFCLKKKTH